MYNIKFNKIYTDKKYCLCGCGETIKEDNWGLKIILDGEICTINDCIEIITSLENQIKELSQNTLTCKYCGNCCNNGPELSNIELEYLIKKFPEYINDFKNIKPGIPCSLGGKNISPCKLPNNAKPLQCRMLFCEANIVGFENLYNKLGKYLGWSILDY